MVKIDETTGKSNTKWDKRIVPIYIRDNYYESILGPDILLNGKLKPNLTRANYKTEIQSAIYVELLNQFNDNNKAYNPIQMMYINEYLVQALEDYTIDGKLNNIKGVRKVRQIDFEIHSKIIKILKECSVYDIIPPKIRKGIERELKIRNL